MSRTFDHEKYEEFVTAKARENEAAIKAALAVGGEPEVQLEIDAMIWAEAEFRAVAEADRRIAEAEERAWDQLLMREPQFT